MNILPCPNCGKQPEYHLSSYWRCRCGSCSTGVIIYGPSGDYDGEGWNEMVLRMRGATPKTKPTPVAYPERVRTLRRKLAQRMDACAKSYDEAIRERNEWRERAEIAERYLAELREAVRDACARLGGMTPKVVEEANATDDGLNWDAVKDSPVGTRLVSDEIAEQFPGGWVERSIVLSFHTWIARGSYLGGNTGIEFQNHHNWRPYTGMTWDQLNAVAKPGDRATCGAFKPEWWIRRKSIAVDDFAENCEEAVCCGFAWTDQADWRILPEKSNG